MKKIETITQEAINEMRVFTEDAVKYQNKTAAARARKASNKLTSLLKEFRKLSIKK